jgi:hypothetical protein
MKNYRLKFGCQDEWAIKVATEKRKRIVITTADRVEYKVYCRKMLKRDRLPLSLYRWVTENPYYRKKKATKKKLDSLKFDREMEKLDSL